MSQLAEILRRRERLLAESAARRGRILGYAVVLARPLCWVDRCVNGARRTLARPVVAGASLAAGMGLLLALGPRRCLAWGAKGWGAWRLWRQFSQGRH